MNTEPPLLIYYKLFYQRNQGELVRHVKLRSPNTVDHSTTKCINKI